MEIKELGDDYLERVDSLLQERWGGPEIATRGQIHHAGQLSGFDSGPIQKNLEYFNAL